MTDTIVVNELSKWFGPKVAVSEVTIGFGPGLTGLLGPNGAGKTTLMRVIAGLQKPSQGSVSILGTDPRRNPDVYRSIALVPEDEAVYERMTARQFVELAAKLSGLDSAQERATASLATVELSDAADRKVGGFSKGMRQRAKVAAALVSDPQVLLLDEPLNGADPVQRARLIDLFKELGTNGRTVIVSSHVLAEVERMADRVIAMVDGRLAAVGTVSDIRNAMTDVPRQVEIECSEPRRLASALMHSDGVVGVQIVRGNIRVAASDAGLLARQLPTIAADNEVGLLRVEPVDESLESVFRYLIDGTA